MSLMMSPMALSPRLVPAASPEARRVVDIVAGTRIGLNMMKSGVDTTNATAEPANVRPEKAKKNKKVAEAITSLIMSNNEIRKDNILKNTFIWMTENEIRFEGVLHSYFEIGW
ncbi:hypothetical protein HID58_045073 [Brassica napus]|uniref:Uncharacterized protein n=1 Tax=Brassica napus TaxID=3708 RepID=A0ABQ8ASJ4_BRANA|nr:hypothetical protein HID58_045073 [Brassica napus]